MENKIKGINFVEKRKAFCVAWIMWRGEKSFHRFFSFAFSAVFFDKTALCIKLQKNHGTVSKNNVTSQRFKLLRESFFVRYFNAHVKSGGTDSLPSPT